MNAVLLLSGGTGSRIPSEINGLAREKYLPGKGSGELWIEYFPGI